MSLCAMQRVWLHALAQQHVGFLTHPKHQSRGALHALGPTPKTRAQAAPPLQHELT